MSHAFRPLAELEDELERVVQRGEGRGRSSAGPASALGLAGPAGGSPSAAALWQRSRRLRVVVLNVALALIATTTGLTAAGVFRRGTPVGPGVPPSPTAGIGVAVPGSVRLAGLRVADPRGGPPWGLRVLRTTRGLTCVQLGRVEFGTIGVLGEDGAFADDGRFHPVSTNAGGFCGISDARGHGFIAVSLQSAPASANVGYEAVKGHCASRLASYPPGFARRLRLHHLQPPGTEHGHGPTCPSGDLHDIYFGLLGPDAVSITYQGADGRLVTTPTSQPDGAFLLIRPPTTVSCQLYGPAHSPVCGNGDSWTPELQAGVITAVRYRDGHTCRLPKPEPAGTPVASCPAYGFVAPLTRRPTIAELRTRVTVEKVPAKAYCGDDEAVVPCDGPTPRGFKRLTGGPPSLLVRIRFRSRVAIPDSRSYYRYSMSIPQSPGCEEGGLGGPTNADIRAGQLVVVPVLLSYSCPGVVRGTLSYVPTEGPASSMAVEGLPGQGKAIPVGRFSFRVP